VKTVFISTFQDEAIVIRSILASGGITSELLADRMMDVNPLFSTDIRGVKIVVPDEFEADALQLVEDYKARRRGFKS
jgi:hypothetical protein